MKEIIQFESLQIEIWRRPRQKTIRLTVKPDGRLRVTCNSRVAKRDILKFLGDSRAFIQKALAEVEKLKAKHPPKKYLSGEDVLFKGQSLRVEVVWTWNKRIEIKVEGDKFEILAPLNSSVPQRTKAVQDFYKNEGRKHLEVRVQHWSSKMGLRPRSLSVRGQTTRWGSCTEAGVISLNWKLMAAPEPVIDYVIVHELAHLEHLNHSPRFWRLVELHMPDYLKLRRWLREFQNQIATQFPKITDEI